MKSSQLRTVKRISLLLPATLLFVATAAACGSGAGSGGGGANPKSVQFKLSFEGSPDIGNLPALIAADEMKKAGYNASTTVIADTPPEIAALRKGSVQMAYSNTISLLKADISKPDLQAVAEAYGSESILVAKKNVKSVPDLVKQGVAVGIESPTSQMATLISFTNAKFGVKLKVVYIANSPSRANALLAGKLQASILQIDDATKVLGQAADQFHIVVNYADLIPENVGASLYTTSSFAKDNPKVVQEFVDQYAKAVKKTYADPAWFKQEGNRLLKPYGYTPDIISKSADQTIAGKIWGKDGLITDEVAKQTVDFNKQVAGITDAQAQRIGKKWYTTQFNQHALQALGQ